MGILNIFKKSRRQINRENQSQGKEGKRIVKRDLEMQGYKVQRTGRGHDFKATKENILTGKKESKYIQVKTGNSPLSKLQKQKKRQFGTRFVEEKLEPTGLGLIKKNRRGKSTSLFNNPKKSSDTKQRTDSWGSIMSAKKPAAKKKSTSGMWGLGTSAKKPAAKKKSTSGMWGLGTSAKKPAAKKKSTSGMWGSSRSSRKSKKKSTWDF